MKNLETWKKRRFWLEVLVTCGWWCMSVLTMFVLDTKFGLAPGEGFVVAVIVVVLFAALCDWFCGRAMEGIARTMMVARARLAGVRCGMTTIGDWRQDCEQIELPPRTGWADIPGVALFVLIYFSIVVANDAFYPLAVVSTLVMIAMAVVTLALVVVGLLAWGISTGLMQWYVPYRCRKNRHSW